MIVKILEIMNIYENPFGFQHVVNVVSSVHVQAVIGCQSQTRVFMNRTLTGKDLALVLVHMYTIYMSYIQNPWVYIRSHEYTFLILKRR